MAVEKLDSKKIEENILNHQYNFSCLVGVNDLLIQKLNGEDFKNIGYLKELLD